LLEIVRSEYEGYSGQGTPACPECGSQDVIRKGRSNGQQRFGCKQCGRRFGARATGALAGTKLSAETWLAFAELMFDGAPLRETALQLGLSVATCLSMRQRVCECLRLYVGNFRVVSQKGLDLDLTYVRESFSGNHSQGAFSMPREPHVRAHDKVKHGVGPHQVCIVTLLNDDDDLFIRPVCLGRAKSEVLIGRLGEWVRTGEIYPADDMPDASWLMECLRDAASRGLDERYDNDWHVELFREIHVGLKEFLKPFSGVSSSMLENYLAWFRWLYQLRSRYLRGQGDWRQTRRTPGFDAGINRHLRFPVSTGAAGVIRGDDACKPSHYPLRERSGLNSGESAT
jgi:transposase-like protein